MARGAGVMTSGGGIIVFGAIGVFFRDFYDHHGVGEAPVDILPVAILLLVSGGIVLVIGVAMYVKAAKNDPDKSETSSVISDSTYTSDEGLPKSPGNDSIFLPCEIDVDLPSPTMPSPITPSPTRIKLEVVESTQLYSSSECSSQASVNCLSSKISKRKRERISDHTITEIANVYPTRVFDLSGRTTRMEAQLPGIAMFTSKFTHNAEISTKGLRYDSGHFRLVKPFWSKTDIGLSIVSSGPWN